MGPPGLGVAPAPRASQDQRWLSEVQPRTSHYIYGAAFLSPHISLCSFYKEASDSPPLWEEPTAAEPRDNYSSSSSHGDVLLFSFPAPGKLFSLWLWVSARQISGPWPSLWPWLLQRSQQPVSDLVCGLFLLLPCLPASCRKWTRRLGQFPLRQPSGASSCQTDGDSTLLQIALWKHLNHKEVQVQVSRKETADCQREREAEDEGFDQSHASPQDIPSTLCGTSWNDLNQDRDAAPHHQIHLLPVSSAGPQWGGAGAEEILKACGTGPNSPLPGSADSQFQSTAIKLQRCEHGAAVVSAAVISGKFILSAQHDLLRCKRADFLPPGSFRMLPLKVSVLCFQVSGEFCLNSEQYWTLQQQPQTFLFSGQCWKRRPGAHSLIFIAAMTSNKNYGQNFSISVWTNDVLSFFLLFCTYSYVFIKL